MRAIQIIQPQTIVLMKAQRILIYRTKPENIIQVTKKVKMLLLFIRTLQLLKRQMSPLLIVQ